MNINKKYLALFIVILVVAIAVFALGGVLLHHFLEQWPIIVSILVVGTAAAAVTGVDAVRIKNKIKELSASGIVSVIEQEMNMKDTKMSFALDIVAIILDVVSLGLFVTLLALMFDQWPIIVSFFVLAAALAGLVFLAIYLMKKTVSSSAAQTAASIQNK